MPRPIIDIVVRSKVRRPAARAPRGSGVIAPSERRSRPPAIFRSQIGLDTAPLGSAFGIESMSLDRRSSALLHEFVRGKQSSGLIFADLGCHSSVTYS